MKKTDAEIVAAVISCRTNAEAAKLLGLSESQLYERMQSTEYRNLLNETVSAQLEGVAGRLRDKLSVAIEQIAALAQDENTPPTVRLAAANALITHYYKLAKTSHDARNRARIGKDGGKWDFLHDI